MLCNFHRNIYYSGELDKVNSLKQKRLHFDVEFLRVNMEKLFFSLFGVFHLHFITALLSYCMEANADNKTQKHIWTFMEDFYRDETNMCLVIHFEVCYLYDYTRLKHLK